MDKQFESDVDPKRIRNVADGLRRQGEFESSRMLRAYADMLEAREKAVPVATVEDQFGFPIMEWIGDAGEKCPVGTNLYTHPSPAELRNEKIAEHCHQAGCQMLYGGCDSVQPGDLDELRIERGGYVKSVPYQQSAIL